MSSVLKKINKYVAIANPTDYDNVSYNYYYKTLSDISDTYIEEKENLKSEILKIEDTSLRLKLLELL